MEKIFEMMRKIKAVLPAEKAGRVICESDGHPPKITPVPTVDATSPVLVLVIGKMRDAK